MIIFSVLIALVGAFFGVMLGYILEIAASASTIGVLTIGFIICMIASPKRRHKRSMLDEHFCVECEKALASTDVCEFCEHDPKRNHIKS